MTFSKLLEVLGRSEDMINVFTLPDGLSHWTTASQAEDEAARWSGEQNVYFGVQPMVEVMNGRGKSRDVTAVVTLYADLDYVGPHKPDGMTPAVAMEIIRDLSDILGTYPSAIVNSGHGLQPYWPVEPVETVEGALLLLRWRQLVIQVAANHGTTVDTGVYDLPRILRVPGPPNLKYGESAKTALVTPWGEQPKLTEVHLTAVFDVVLGDEVTRQYDRETMRQVRSDVSTGDRVFTDEQALAFLDEFAFTPARKTPWGAGADYWKILWQCAMCCSNFTEMFDEDDLKDQLRQAVSSGHDDASLDVNDEYQIALGFLKGREWLARRPSAEELSNPFSPYCNLAATVRERYDIPEDEPLTIEVVYSNPKSAGMSEEEAAEAVLAAAEQIIDDMRHLKVTFANEMQMEAATWLWEHSGEFWLPLRSLVLLGGREGVGKSTWTARLIAQVTNGKMHGEYLGKPKSVVICAAEDSWEVTILPRLVAAGANLKRVMRVDAEQSGRTFGLTLPTDVPALLMLTKQQDVALIVLDPLLGTVQGKLDTHKDSDVRQALAPISQLAHETHCTVIGLIHQNKNQAGDLLTRMMGSRAFAAVARAVLVCAEAPPAHEAGEFDLLRAAEPSDGPKAPRQFLFGQLKNNLGPRVETSVKYEIEGALAGMDRTDPKNPKPIRTSKIKVIKYGDLADVEETVLAKEKAQRDATDKRRKPDGVHPRCMAWIKATLEINGPMLSAELKAGAEKAGFNAAAYKKACSEMELKKTGTYHDPILELPDSWSPSDALKSIIDTEE